MNNNSLVIGIYAGLLYYKPKYQHYYDETNLIYGNIGGADVWVFEIANEFVKQGNSVIVFNDCKKWHYSENGIEYVPLEYFTYVIKIKKFDIFISNRRISPFNESISAKKKILMMHEIFLLDEVRFKENNVPKFDVVAYQSNSQLDEIFKRYPFLKTKLSIKTNQSIDFKLYSTAYNIYKGNSMVWSSHKSRGLEFFVKNIFPKIRSRVPDFMLYVCSYINDNQDEYLRQNGIQVIQNISRQELSLLQMKSKIWAYTNIGEQKERPIETFCITAMENAAAFNALILPKNDSFIDIFNAYEEFIDLSTDEETIIKNYIDKSIKCLLNENKRMRYAQEAYSIINKYTWQTAAKSFLKTLEI